MRWLMTSGTPGLTAAGVLPNDIAGQAELALAQCHEPAGEGPHDRGRYCQPRSERGSCDSCVQNTSRTGPASPLLEGKGRLALGAKTHTSPAHSADLQSQH